MKRLSASMLRIGEPVPFDCYDGKGLLLLRQGERIASRHQLENLIDRGLYRRPPPETAPPAPAVQKTEANSPFLAMQRLEDRLAAVFADFARNLRYDAAERILSVCREIQDWCAGDPDALLGAIHLEQGGRYTVFHALHKAVLSELLATRKGWPATERISLLAAALTGDVSIVELQKILNRQHHPLSQRQRDSLRLHPQMSVELLRQHGVTDRVWLEAVLHHHERLDGSGYPLGLAGEAVPQAVRILALADSYSAMIVPRSWRPGMGSKEALGQLFRQGDKAMDGEMAQLLVKELGVFPPGAFVQLQNGETAIVVKRGPRATDPLVKSLAGPAGSPLPEPVRRDTSDPAFGIKGLVARRGIFRVDPHLLWDYPLALAG